MQHKHRHRLTLRQPGVETELHFLIPMSDAKKNVTLDREECDAYNGVSGYAITCMNSQCGTRLADRFPHRVYMMEFTDTRAFVVDQVDRNGHPKHCVRYYHHEGDEQLAFDTDKRAFLRSGRAKKTFQLLKPTPSVKHDPNPNPKPRNEKTTRVRGTPRLSWARVLRARVASVA